ncbi:MAG: endosialidase [Lachnospiraceae bacterium]|nr:endosialidase [Lachnospiraceae bacterium]
MAVVEELIRNEADGSLSFGNFDLPEKKKVSDFEHDGDLYKVKTFKDITKLERNGLFVYESVPGTVVTTFKADEKMIEFNVEGLKDSSVTLELEPETEYKVFINDNDGSVEKTNLGGKLILSLLLEKDSVSKIKIEKV